MPKLRLKRTPEEEAAHQLRKQQRKEHKRKHKHEHVDKSHKRHRPDSRLWASSDEESPLTSDRQPGSSHSHGFKNPDYESIRADLEEQQFREKLSDAFADDERLDSLEARFNDFAHVPGRWRTDGVKLGKPVYSDSEWGQDEFLKVDPRYMDDEEYAEWIRVGMYRQVKTHAKEYAEEQRKKEMKAQRRAEEKARKFETQRLEKIAEEERRLKRLEREDRRRQFAREEYELRWNTLLSTSREDNERKQPQELGFYDIPWPTLAAYRHTSAPASESISHSLEHLSADAILEFLLPPSSRSMADSNKAESDKKERKEKLRETFLRFHPDKFEGRFMKLIKEGERETVREAIGQVVRSLNVLMSDGS
ncbi:hypothetical protein C0992_006428 [Termitomyces sp. T32_za158]|nr:hypothetical protein C0992_006428 [Termitomyces sp. T32_za158]